MAKKRASAALTVSSASSYTDLLKEAEEAAKRKYRTPRPWQFVRLWRVDPCKLCGSQWCGDDHVENHNNSWVGHLAFMSVIFAIFTVSSAWTLTHSVLWAGLTVFINAIPFTWANRYPAWFSHKRDFESLIPQDPDELLRRFLLGRFDGIYTALLGDNAELRVLQGKMHKQLEEARRIRTQLASRNERRTKGEHKERVTAKIAELDGLIERLASAKQNFDDHIARVAAYLAECRTELEGVASDMPLMDEADALTRAAEESMEAVDGAVMSSLLDLQGRLAKLQQETTQALGEADAMFASRSRLPADLEAFERLAATTFSAGSIPRLPEAAPPPPPQQSA